MMAATPASSKRRAMSSADNSDVAAQPSTATLPSRASRPTATRPGYARAASLTSAGSRTAAVPMITRATPLPSQPSMVARSRMPPPSCSGILTAPRMPSTAETFIGLPANAPSRSTKCRYSKPWRSNACACAAGSRLNTVARAMSPCCRRTARPSLRSMAGNRITAQGLRLRGVVTAMQSRIPLQKVRDQRQPELLAFLWMELGAENVVARHDRGDGAAILGIGHKIGALRRIELIRVREIAMQALWAECQAVEHGMRSHDIERVPAHVRDFQVRIARHDAIDFAGDPTQAFRHFIFTAALGQELHADANAEERLASLAHRLVQRPDHAVHRVEAAPAIGEGADTRQHDTVRLRHHRRIVGHHDGLTEAGLVRGAFECFCGRVQVTGAVVDDRHAHRRAPGSGNSPITSDPSGPRQPGATDAGPGVGAYGPLDGELFRCSQASKKRRSASSRSSPLTTARFFQPRRFSVKRRNVPASSPTRRLRSRPMTLAAKPGAPDSLTGTSIAPATTT